MSLISSRHVKLSASEQHLPDDGIGTSDDETGSNSSTVKTADTGSNHDEDVGPEVEDVGPSEDDGGGGNGDGTQLRPNSANKKVIKLDMGQLLAFDEVTIYTYDG